MTAFGDACARLEAALRGPLRQTLAADLTTSPDLRTALSRLRETMRAHVWEAGDDRIDLAGVIDALDMRTRSEGFHALHDWDGKAVQVNQDSIAVNVVDFLIDHRGTHPPTADVVAILIDYYFAYLIGLLTLRAWDGGDPDGDLDRLNQLVDDLQGSHGSGQRIADNAETLLLIVTSHYEANEDGYVTLLRRVRELSHPHQVAIGVIHAASMGCHLRFGFEATYGRDTLLMRDDNVADYPWVCYALATVAQEYARLREGGGDADAVARRAIVEAMLNGLSPDARAFVGDRPPSSLEATAADRAAVREVFQAYREDLVGEFESCRPSDHGYSPFAFFYNFAQNVVKGTVVDALLWGQAWRVSLNDLLTARVADDAEAAGKLKLATTLMGYARANPDTIRGRPMPAIVYDPQTGRQAFGAALRQLRDAADA